MKENRKGHMLHVPPSLLPLISTHAINTYITRQKNYRTTLKREEEPYLWSSAVVTLAGVLETITTRDPIKTPDLFTGALPCPVILPSETRGPFSPPPHTALFFTAAVAVLSCAKLWKRRSIFLCSLLLRARCYGCFIL